MAEPDPRVASSAPRDHHACPGSWGVGLAAPDAAWVAAAVTTVTSSMGLTVAHVAVAA
jgi:hypothetical protein